MTYDGNIPGRKRTGAETATASLVEFNLGPEYDWIGDALCAQIDADSFFPEVGGTTADAKAVCERCTVRVECLETALDNGEAHGVWGGMSEYDRKQERRRRRTKAA